MYTPEEIEIANKTSRNSKAFGKKAVVPQVVKRLFSPQDGLSILDFGAGKAAAHTLSLREDGYTVDAFEFGDNSIPGLHIDGPLISQTYNVIYASNVLNVQSSLGMLEQTLYTIACTLKPGGTFIANYPASPRKLGYSVDMMTQVIEEYFNVERVKHNNNVVYLLTRKIN